MVWIVVLGIGVVINVGIWIGGVDGWFLGGLQTLYVEFTCKVITELLSTQTFICVILKSDAPFLSVSSLISITI